MSQHSPKTLQGNCHCGAFKFEITAPEIRKAQSCNCSLCSKKGYLWIFPQRDQFRVNVILGNEVLKGYEFGTFAVSHKFCPTCGTGVLLERNVASREIVAVDARTLLNVNPFTLEITKFDGTSRQPTYTPPKFTGTLPIVGEGQKIYTGSCHCGATTLAIKTKPLSEIEVKEDNCSVCQRNANVMIYPNQSQVTIVGEENTTEYRFGRKFTGHRFCQVCGVQVYMKIYGPPRELFDKWLEARKAAARENFELLPIRVGVLNNVEYDRLTVRRIDEGTRGYKVE